MRPIIPYKLDEFTISGSAREISVEEIGNSKNVNFTGHFNFGEQEVHNFAIDALDLVTLVLCLLR